MHALDDVTAVVEHTANVLGVHSAGEVGVAVVAPISTGICTHQKLIADEVLGPGHAWVLSGLRSPRTILGSSVASKFWKVVLNFRFPSKDFLSEQVLLVEEQNHRDGSPHPPVVPDALEEVQSLLQAVGLVVLPDDHVVAAAGHHEDDGSHIFSTETLDPFAALITLATHVKHAAGERTHGHCPGRTLLTLSTWNLVSKIPEVRTRQRINQLVLVGALIAGADSFILPQSLGVLGGAYRREVKVGHVHHTQDVIHSELVLGVGQLHGGHQIAHGTGTYFNGLFQVVFDVLHFGGLLTTVGLKRKQNHIASRWRTVSL
uniref:Uncharacterized protein n=1 Tax=Rhinolophus ferrumequinum TaxID=59479 RepID=A0A671G7G1_RHIFE